MVSRGNIPAGALNDTLANICKIAASDSSAYTMCYARLFPRQLTVVRDAETFSRAIVGVVDIPQPTTEWPENSAGEGEPSIVEHPTGGQNTIPSARLGPAPG